MLVPEDGEKAASFRDSGGNTLAEFLLIWPRLGRVMKWSALLLGTFVIMSCSSDEPGGGPGVEPEPSDEVATEAEDGEAPPQTGGAATEAADNTTDPIADDAVGNPAFGNPATTTGSAPAARPGPTASPDKPGPIQLWLGRGEMTDRSITLHWAIDERAGAVGYTLHRLPFDPTVDPITAKLDDATAIHRSTEVGLVDSDVETGAGYWYVLLALDESGFEHRRAAEAHAVTDVEPPDRVADLQAVVDEAAITLRWMPSGDNYRFGRYSIRRSVDAAESIYYGTGWTVDQTTFIDDRPPPSGSRVRYEVAATDFHGNTTKPTIVEVTAN